jgi:hypothetical protein
MKNIHFATRVASTAMPKSDSSNAHNSERIKVQAAVNAHPITIDRTVFQKTDAEKMELATVKAHWKKLQRLQK